MRRLIAACALLLCVPAHSAVLVGFGASTSITVVTAAKGNGSTGTCSATISPTAGNALIAAFGTWTNSTPSSDSVATNGSAPASFTRIGSQVQDSVSLSLHYLGNVGSGATSVTFTAGEEPTVSTCIVYEVSGLSATPFTTGEVADDGRDATENPQTADVTNATANSIFFAAAANTSGDNPATIAINGTGSDGTWSVHANGEYKNGNNVVLSVPYQIVSSGAARSHGWTTGLESAAVIISAFHE